MRENFELNNPKETISNNNNIDAKLAHGNKKNALDNAEQIAKNSEKNYPYKQDLYEKIIQQYKIADNLDTHMILFKVMEKYIDGIKKYDSQTKKKQDSLKKLIIYDFIKEQSQQNKKTQRINKNDLLNSSFNKK